MCTLSIIVPAAGEFVLAFNRDETPHRAEGEVAEHGAQRRFLAPTDCSTGGTWIAVNDAGIACALLNRNEPALDALRESGGTRAQIVPGLAECATLAACAARLESVASSITRGFRLVATDGAGVLEGLGGAGRVHITITALERTFVRASSGLGDHLVQPPRYELFASTVALASTDALANAQRDFHLHRWADRTHLSVLMDRDAARTVSQTVIHVDPTRVTLSHARRAGVDIEGEGEGESKGKGKGFHPAHTRELVRA